MTEFGLGYVASESTDAGGDTPRGAPTRARRESRPNIAPARATHRPCPTEHLQALFDANAHEQQFPPGSTVLLHGDPANAIFLIQSGTVRCCTINTDGGRQIFDFARKGSYLGISDIDVWHFTAEAVDHVIVKSVPRPVVEQELAVNICLRQEMRALLRNLLMCREQQLLALISQKAPDRLLGFLRAFSASRATTGFVVLPMSRRDIGDHLGMTMETTSRAFGVLKSRGLIEMTTPEKFRLVG